jgi:phage tail-like protein
MADEEIPKAGGYYPPVGFHFRVEFEVLIDPNKPGEYEKLGGDNDIRFQSVSGLSVEYDMESFKEGGENRFEHKLPIRTKYADLSFKRGMLNGSEVVAWMKDAFQNRTFKTALVHIKLLNENHEPLKTWHVYNAWPKKWSVSDFNAQENAIVVETLDLSYSFFTTE